MSEPRFTCPQCPTECTDCDADDECNAPFTLPNVLEHWRWHTQQATHGRWRNDPDTGAGRVWVKVSRERERSRFKWPRSSGSPCDLEPLFRVRTSDEYAQREADAAHIARMSPAFTLTLIEQLEAWGTGEVYPPDVDRVVAVVVAAGFEQVGVSE